MGFFTRHIKDPAVSSAIRFVVKNMLKEMGTLEYFALNSESKSIFLSLMLQGEIEPLSISIDGYQLIKENQNLFFTCQSITASKKWLQIAAQKFISSKKIRIPQKYATMISHIL